MAALVHIPVGVLVERIKAESQWVDYIWQPTAVLIGAPDAKPWTRLSGDDKRAQYFAGSAAIKLYRSDAGNYRDNLLADRKLWVVLTTSESDPPYILFMVTADPTEGEAQTETGVNLVEAVPMPDTVRAVLEEFVAEHHVEQAFFKRSRDRADPDALGRRAPSGRGGDDD
ncbi:MAG: DUF3305 domain-containing protein [Pseudorhodoplanes sp.]|uniref:DUF3305 domain-containing protein n=1 Tax=Pseudorhodoplanes sp. TaxID=1934341 RepID=UPI003D1225DB